MSTDEQPELSFSKEIEGVGDTGYNKFILFYFIQIIGGNI